MERFQKWRTVVAELYRDVLLLVLTLLGLAAVGQPDAEACVVILRGLFAL